MHSLQVSMQSKTESSGKARMVGTGNASAKGQGKQVKSPRALCYCTVISTTMENEVLGER
jgi:hypothetical protein